MLLVFMIISTCVACASSLVVDTFWLASLIGCAVLLISFEKFGYRQGGLDKLTGVYGRDGRDGKIGADLTTDERGLWIGYIRFNGSGWVVGRVLGLEQVELSSWEDWAWDWR